MKQNPVRFLDPGGKIAADDQFNLGDSFRHAAIASQQSDRCQVTRFSFLQRAADIR
jgi:hypothetical protein